MKNLLSLLLIIFCLFACSSEDEKVIETTLSVSKTDINFFANDKSKEFQITSNSIWEISGVPDWITVSDIKGQGNKTIIINADINELEHERIAILTIKADEKLKSIKIRQYAKDVNLALSESEIVFEAEPSSNGISIDVMSNNTWEIVDVPQWLSLSKESGDGNESITIFAERNSLESVRKATITIKAGTKFQTLKITQEAFIVELSFTDEYLISNYDTSYLIFDENTGIQSVIVKSNTQWKVKSTQTWCVLDVVESENIQTLNIALLDNPNESERRAEVIISAGSKSIKLYVLQNGKPEEPGLNPYELTVSGNMPRNGDKLIKKQIAYVNPGESGENITWDFSTVSIINEQYSISYDTPPVDLIEGYYIMGNERFNINEIPLNSLIVCNEPNAMYYYQLKDNVLQSIGHENPVTILHYNPRMILGLLPMKYSDYKKENYISKGLYSGTVSIGNEGSAEVIADGYGTIKFPDGIYNNVLRVKWVQTMILNDEQGISTGEIGTEYTIYKWYVKGYRYPVLETHRIVDVTTNTETFSTAFYYPPKDHTYMQNEKVKTLLRTNNNQKQYRKIFKRATSPIEGVFPILQSSIK